MDSSHKKCLLKNRPFLLEEISMSVDFLGNLSAESVITEDQQERLENIQRNDTTKAAVQHFLLQILPKRGPAAFNKFLKALRDSEQDHVADQLDDWLKKNGGPPSTSRALPTKPSMFTKGISGSEDQKDCPPLSIDQLLHDIEENSCMKINLQKTKMSTESTKGCYKVTHETRGLAVIINNVDFRGKFDKRDSSVFDVINMAELFRKLHFEVKKHKDKDAQGIIKCLEDERSNLPESDIFVAVIMSHGSKNCVYGTDGESVQIEDIIDIFNGTKCPILKNTPKVFFIQACQGDERVASESDESDGASQHDGPLMTELQRGVTDLNLDEPDAQPTESTENEKLHRIVVTSTALGDTAWRQSDLGSPFIRAIVAVFNHFAHLEHLEDMISMVTDVMLQWGKKHSITQICEKTRAPLAKKLYFFP